jgi:hypothetical protein
MKTLALLVKKSSVVDLSPHGSALILVGWTRIRQESKKYTQERTFMFCSAECYLLKAEGFSLKLGHPNMEAKDTFFVIFYF